MSQTAAGAGQAAQSVRRIALGSDHAGFSLKEELRRHLEDHGVVAIDLGTHGTDSVDYPEYAEKVARFVVEGHASLGLLVCGTGVGIGIAANKIRGIRAATVSDPASARLSRQHNDANVLCLGSRIVGIELARQIVDAWLAADFEGGRHAHRVNQIAELEQKAS